VTVDQFAACVYETRYQARKCWRNAGFAQDGSHPAVCLSWDDARAYADWPAKKTRKPCRLLSEEEFDYAARGRNHAAPIRASGLAMTRRICAGTATAPITLRPADRPNVLSLALRAQSLLRVTAVRARVMPSA
jgi:hypothetical protein